MKLSIRTAALALAAVAALATFAVAPAAAQATWGPRAGLSFNPDQVVLGAHVQFPVATQLYIVPNADLAFGDDAFTISINGDLQYRFASSGSVKPYVGGGVTYISYDPDVEGADSVDETGISALGGVWFNATGSTPFFLEGKLFFSDRMPDFKVLVGLNL